MIRKLDPVAEHVRLIEARIQKQIGEIERLKNAGLATDSADRRLALLNEAMEDMRFQLAQLTPTIADKKRPVTAVSVIGKPSGKK